jgi:CubicO group peptidase (beta-lactamase class C family)
VAQPHWAIQGTVTRIENASVDGVAPAGSVWSNADDMAKWSAMLLAGGKAGTRTLLSPAAVEELFKPQAMVTSDAFYPTARLTRPKWTTYGLGWFQQDYRGHAVDYHTGSIDGMVAIHGLLRDQGVGVIVLANLDHAELRHAIMLDVFDRYIGGARRDWSGDLRSMYQELGAEAEAAAKKAEAARVADTKPSLPLSAYAGAYSDPLYGDAVVTVEGNRLRLTYGGAYSGLLDHWHFDTFRARWDAAWRGTALVSFGLDTRGRPAHLETMGARFTKAPAARGQ